MSRKRENAMDALVSFLMCWYGSSPDYLCRPGDEWLPQFIPAQVRENIKKYMWANSLGYGRSNGAVLERVAAMKLPRRIELAQSIEVSMFLGFPMNLPAGKQKKEETVEADTHETNKVGRSISFDD